MNKMEYMPVDCLQVPKMLFQVEEFKNLSNTAKILYSLFLDRLKFAVQNGWVDHNGDLFVIYPKSEMKKDLKTTRYGVDQAVQELVTTMCRSAPRTMSTASAEPAAQVLTALP